MADVFPTTIPPDRVLTVSHEYNTTVVRFEKSRNKQRFSNQRYPTRRYRLEWKIMTLPEMATFTAHFDDRRGSFRGFLFNDSRLPAGVIFRFVRDSFQFDKINHYFADITVEVET